MRSLFLNFENLDEIGGITNKIIAQNDALRHNGFDTSLSYIKKGRDKGQYLYINDELVINYGKGLWGKLRRLFLVTPLIKWIIYNNIEFIYVRYTRFSNPFYVYLFKRIKKLGVISFLEIPTYPYDKEILHPNLASKLLASLDKRYRLKLVRYINRIITFSDDLTIWGCPTIRVLNGVDSKLIPLRYRKKEEANNIILIGVASVQPWHGYDRVIKGLKQYYERNPSQKVYFRIVGGNGSNPNFIYLQKMVKEFELEEYVIFYGEKSGYELDDLFNTSDIAIGSLGRHRNGINKFQSLKNVEYAMRGIPFIYSEIGTIFDNENFVFQCESNDSPIDIFKLIEFYRSVKSSPCEIRKQTEVKGVEWDVQFQKIVNDFNLLRDERES